MDIEQAVPGIRLRLDLMPQLAEAVDKEDDWTGITDAAARRKRQNRLNVRAHRRRKALAAKALQAEGKSETTPEQEIPCWIEEDQKISTIPTSLVKSLRQKSNPLMSCDVYIPNANNFDMYRSPSGKIILPLSTDHLITLQQFNVLRSGLTNRRLLSPLTGPDPDPEALITLPSPSSSLNIPPSLLPTFLQRTHPHPAWIDIIPSPRWRDNLILLHLNHTFTPELADELWSDTVGGLFEGFPDDECKRSGVVAWWPPWDIKGWEVSEGFWRKWKWTLVGCEGILGDTNRRRGERGEDPIDF